MNDQLGSEGFFTSFDGVELFYRHWISSASGKKAVILLHRGHEHSGRVASLFHDLNLDGFQGFAYDMRGHGKSPGERGVAENYGVLIKDLNAFMNHIRDSHGIATTDMALVANSVGAVNAVTWLHDYGVQVRCMVLAAPAFRIKLYVPLAIPGLRLLSRINHHAMVTSYVRSSMLTHDVAQAKSYDDDKLITRKISVRVLLGLYDAATRILDDAGSIDVPTLVISAGADYVVQNKAHEQFINGISSRRKEHVTYPGMHHAIFYETNRVAVIEKARQFIVTSFEVAADEEKLLTADQQGFTKREYDQLHLPASFAKKIFFGSQILSMKSLGKMSKGIRLGLDTGFDSGKSLDHVYKNKAEGSTAIGKIIDRGYLDAIGWRGIRLRKDNLKYWLSFAIKKSSHKSTPVCIMDIASGPGRYLLELKRDLPDKCTLILRDNVQANLDEARKIADDWALDGVSYILADAFDVKQYAQQTAKPATKPDIVVISGLFELFPANEKIVQTLKAIANVIAPGGYLIYTGQPWHPQIELIARTLTNREGKPWIMRRRSQAELNALIQHAGFERMDSRIDDYGIFTVSLARKAG